MSAYELNRMMYDLRLPACRQVLRKDVGTYLAGYDLTEEERRLVHGCHWQGLVDAGASVYVLTKLGAALGVSLLEMGAAMRGQDMEGFRRFVADQGERNRPHALLPGETGTVEVLGGHPGGSELPPGTVEGGGWRG